MLPLTSRERMLAVLHHEQPDHVPLIFNTFGFRPPAELAWTDQYEEAQSWLSLGVDAWLRMPLPLDQGRAAFHPDVQVREWVENPPDARWPVMVKEYQTPAGALRQEVYRTEDWVSPDWPMHKGEHQGVDLLDDYNVVRSRRFLIQGEEDLPKLAYLLCSPPDDVISRWREQAAYIGRRAQEMGVMTVSWEPAGADMLTWLCGVDGMLWMALERPDLLSALLEMLHAWDRRNIELLLDTPVDMIMRRGYYEGTIFWSPRLYRHYFAPLIQDVVGQVHQAGRFSGYIMSVGWVPLLDTLANLGFDAHFLLDPIAGDKRVDLARVRAAYAGKVAVIGGLNTHITLEQGSPADIRREVLDAIQHLGPGGGLALSAAEAICASTPWTSVETVIAAWREARDYPLVF
jgi:hypothetical protein